MKTTIRRSMTALASAAALLIAADVSAADTTQAYCIPSKDMNGGFMKNGAPDDTLSLIGSSIEADGTLRLTEAKDLTASGAYYNKEVELTNADKTNRPLHVYFSFSITPNADGKIGAGLAFVGQRQGVGDVGGNGDKLGYGDIHSSLAIEFDTRSDDLQNSGDHIGFMLNGDTTNHAAYSLLTTSFTDSAGFASAAGEPWHAWVDYSGKPGEVLVYLSKTKVKPAKAIEWKVLDSADFMSGFETLESSAWFGFSAANYGDKTGGSTHAIHEWEFSNEGIPCACQSEQVDSACPTELRACSTGKDTLNTGLCVECTASEKSACNEKGQICNTDKEQCGPCSKDADCNDHPAGNRCVLSGAKKGTCVECVVDEHCPTDTPVCDPDSNRCEECLEDVHCPGDKPVCNPTKHICEPCTINEDCSGHPENPVCATKGEKKGECIPAASVGGGGLACAAVAPGESTNSSGTLAGVMGALGAAAMVARRRRRSGKGA